MSEKKIPLGLTHCSIPASPGNQGGGTELPALSTPTLSAARRESWQASHTYQAKPLPPPCLAAAPTHPGSCKACFARVTPWGAILVLMCFLGISRDSTNHTLKNHVLAWPISHLICPYRSQLLFRMGSQRSGKAHSFLLNADILSTISPPPTICFRKQKSRVWWGNFRESPGSPGVGTLSSHCCRLRFNPWSGNWDSTAM